MSPLLRSSAATLGEYRGSPRVYLQGLWLAKAGFTPNTRFRVRMRQSSLELVIDSEGDRKVSGKKDNTVPVIDLNFSQLNELKSSKVEVRSHDGVITLTPSYTVLLVSGRQLTNTEGSLFSGGGFLSEAARSLGFVPRFAVEVDPQYADIFERNHPNAVMFNSSVSEVAWDLLQQFRPLGLLTMGIPCEPYSTIRRLDKGGQQKRDKALPPEAHDLGDMAFWAMRAVEATNPHTVVIENVPGFLESGTGYVVQSVLRRMGYYVDARIINPLDYGELTGRKRAIVIAHSKPIEWPDACVSTRCMGDILEAEPHDWWTRQTKPWPFVHWENQTAKGNGFEPPKVTAADRSVGTIKKRYFAGQGDNPVVAHPTEEGTYRWFTLNEVKRLHGIPDTYDLGESKTLAGEVMGQGVVVSAMARILQGLVGAHA